VASEPDFLFQDGAGPLFDIGPYYLTALYSLRSGIPGDCGRVEAKPIRTIGSGPRAGETFEVTVPTHVSALFEFETRARTAQSVFSFDSKLGRTQFEVAGGRHAVVPDRNTFDGELLVWARARITYRAHEGHHHESRNGVAELAQAIRAVDASAPREQAFTFWT